MAETAETVNSIRGHVKLNVLQYSLAYLRNRWPVCVSIDLRNVETSEDAVLGKMVIALFQSSLRDLSDLCVSKLQ